MSKKEIITHKKMNEKVTDFEHLKYGTLLRTQGHILKVLFSDVK